MPLLSHRASAPSGSPPPVEVGRAPDRFGHGRYADAGDSEGSGKDTTSVAAAAAAQANGCTPAAATASAVGGPPAAVGGREQQ